MISAADFFSKILKNKKARLAICSLFVASALAACGGDDSPPASSASPSAQTTVMVYMIGSDLESGGADGPQDGGAATGNLLEMMKGSLPPNANVVIESGGAKQTSRAGSPIQDWTTVQREVLMNGAIQPLINGNLGPIDMAQPSSLSDFINFAHENYPAQNYRLLLWDHGSGWRGYGTDEISKQSFSLSRLAQALQDARAKTNIHFDLIGFDACLMATVEAAAALAPYADYLLASEELEPGPGWNWTVVVDNASADTRTFGTQVIDAYVAKQKSIKEYATLSLIDLTKISTVMTALGNWAGDLQSLISSPANWADVAWARLTALSYPVGENAKYYDEVDLGQLVCTFSASAIAADSSNALLQAVSKAIVYQNATDDYKDSTGLTIYFPSKSLSNQAVDADYQQLSFLPSYQRFTQAYVAMSETFGEGALFNIATSGTSPTMHYETASDAGLAEIDNVLASGELAPGQPILIGSTPRPINYKGPRQTSDVADISVSAAAADNQWITLNGHPIMIARAGKQNLADGTQIEVLGAPIKVNGIDTILLFNRDGSDNLTPVGTIKLDDDEENPGAERLMPLPTSTDEIITRGIPYDTATDAFMDMVDTSSPFTADFSSFALSFTSIDNSTVYKQGILATDLAQNMRLSDLTARTN